MRLLSDRFASALPELALPWQAAPTPAPQLLLLNEPLAREVGLDPSWLRGEGLGLLTGTAVPEGARPVAQAYAGHQFGGYTPRLGDGRALLLGELPGPRDLHLKGSGRTPFSRGGDGLAAVGPMLREYVVSEAMHALGIPTTRALAVVATGQLVRRETALPGAVLSRVASSHLRVGSFQYARATGDLGLLRRLADHAIERHHPGVTHLGLLDAVIAVQARLVAQWMLVGFVHGVMNTDNTTISGETIDYGPCAFMEAFDPATRFSSIDEHGRYAYGQQPLVLEWNLARLAEAMLPLFADDEAQAVELAVASLRGYRPAYLEAWSSGMARKLGLSDLAGLDEDLLPMMAESKVDHTGFYRALARLARGQEGPRDSFLDRDAFDRWAARWLALGPDPDLMDRVNPVYVPRNHLVEAALTAASDGDLSLLPPLLEAVTDPYVERPGLRAYAQPGTAPDYQTFCGT